MIPVLFLALQLTTPLSKLPIVIPPKAAEPAGAIGQVLLAPLFRSAFACVEHTAGQLPMAGDALGTDCQIIGGLSDDSGFARMYRTDGATNADWYGWHADVLSPTDGTVVGLYINSTDNVPGTMGKPPASIMQIQRADGIMVSLGHIADPKVKVGDKVVAGQLIAVVGNNGMARAPHIHIGAYRMSNAEPLQIRWDQRAMSKLQGE